MGAIIQTRVIKEKQKEKTCQLNITPVEDFSHVKYVIQNSVLSAYIFKYVWISYIHWSSVVAALLNRDLF